MLEKFYNSDYCKFERECFGDLPFRSLSAYQLRRMKNNPQYLGFKVMQVLMYVVVACLTVAGFGVFVLGLLNLEHFLRGF